MDKIKVDIEYEKVSAKEWSDSEKRADHISDRMELRGISTENIKEAVNKGSKKIRADGSIVSEFRWYKVAYRQFNVKDIKKIYPITVMEL